MNKTNWSTYLPLILVWLVSALAGVSFIKQAITENSRRQPSRGWRKFLQGIRFRLTLAAGIGLILFVISGVVWVLYN
ncbi:MAG: hypothetical protein WCK35_12835 [Chloroflexota bacterium]